MRKPDSPGGIVKSARKSAALVVDQDKRYFVRMVEYCHRENICDQEFTLTGSGHACHQAVGTLEFLVQVQLEERTVGSNADRRCQ